MSDFLVLAGLLVLPAVAALVVWRLARRNRWTGTKLETALAVPWIFLLGPAYWAMSRDLPQRLCQVGSFFCALTTLVFIIATGYSLLLASLYYVDREIRGTEWSLTDSVSYNMKEVLLGYMPMAFVVGGCIAISVGAERLGLTGTAVRLLSWVGGPVILFGVFMTYPQLVSILFDAYPLAPGPLRETMMALVARAGLQVRNVMVIPGRKGKILNAWVSGPAPFNRYIFLSEFLLDHLAPEEVEAVLAHELGHIHHRHLIQYAASSLVSLTASSLVFTAVFTIIPKGVGSVMIVGMCLGILWSVLFGWVSRRAELQADRFAANLLGNPEPLIAALQKLEVPLSASKDPGIYMAGLAEDASSHPGADSTAAQRAVPSGRQKKLNGVAGSAPLPA